MEPVAKLLEPCGDFLVETPLVAYLAGKSDGVDKDAFVSDNIQSIDLACAPLSVVFWVRDVVNAVPTILSSKVHE